MPANYVLLERIELNASAASVTFANIPQSGYTDLKVVTSLRSNYAANGSGAAMKFNSSSTGYSYKQIYGFSGGAGSTGSASAIEIGYNVNSTNSTSNTFTSTEFYIPNYTSSNNKSVSIEGAFEMNSTTGWQLDMFAYLWSNSAAITTISITENNSSSFIAGSTFSLYGLAALGTTPVIAPKASGGDVIDFDGTYWIHTFLTSGTFTPTSGLTCDYLVVAGGGGGSTYAGGGGGAGGYKYATSQSLSATNYTVTVGAGGSGYIGSGSGLGTNGNNSVFNADTMTGGGRGGGNTGFNGASGGSGGGAAGISSATGGAATSGQGFAGGDSPGASGGGGGGGGSAAVGSNGTNTEVGGNGGTGTANSITGTSITRAGGGGGAGSIGAAGTGAAGGGNGGKGVGVAGSNATVNTGSGGGGCWLNASAGNGGSGVVIIRYLA